MGHSASPSAKYDASLYYGSVGALDRCTTVHQLALRRCVAQAALSRPRRPSVWQGVELLSAPLQSVAVLQVGVVALGDAPGAVEETPAAAGNHCGAVAVAWATRTETDIKPEMKKKNLFQLKAVFGCRLLTREIIYYVRSV